MTDKKRRRKLTVNKGSERVVFFVESIGSIAACRMPIRSNPNDFLSEANTKLSLNLSFFDDNHLVIGSFK